MVLLCVCDLLTVVLGWFFCESVFGGWVGLLLLLLVLGRFCCEGGGGGGVLAVILG